MLQTRLVAADRVARAVVIPVVGPVVGVRRRGEREQYGGSDCFH
jgi:hypothetical protein